MSQKDKFTKAEQETREANAIRNKQDKIRNRFDYLQEVHVKHFQEEYVRAQAKEVCKILNELKLTPLNSLFTKVNDFMYSVDFMYDMYLTENEFGMLEPDEVRIKKLILPDPTPED